MKNSFLFYELKRMLKSKFTQITILLSSLFPLVAAMFATHVGQEVSSLILGLNSLTLLSQVVLLPAKAGAVFSVIVFTALTVFEFDKILRFRVNYIIEPIASSLKINITKVIGLICVGGISTIASIIIMIPFYIFKVGSLNNVTDLLICFVVITWGSIVFAVLMTAGFYLIFRKVNVTCIIMFLAVFFSFFAGTINYQYMWVQNGARGLSENFGIGNAFIGMLYNRLFGLTVTMTIFLFGMMCHRCYEKGVFQSFFKNCRKQKMLLICFLISFCGIFFVFKNEPIFKSVSPGDLASMLISGDKNTPINTNIKGTSNISIDFEIEKDRNYASGDYVQEIQNVTDKPQDIYFDLSDGYHINEVKLDDKEVSYTQVSAKIMNSAKLKNVFELTVPQNTQAKLSIKYEGRPKCINSVGDFSLGISKDYIYLKKACDVTPVVRIDKNDINIEGTIKADSKFTVITSGDKNNEISEDDGLKKWSFSSNKPDDLCLTAGQYGIFERDISGTKVEFFYPMVARKEFESRGEDTLDVFTFFSEKFGPLCRDDLKVVITSGVYGEGGSQSGNISYVSEDCLNKKTKIDSPQASSSDTFSVLTHEIAHQWWGNGIDVSNEKSDNQIDKKHDEWSNEAFADFSTYLFLRKKFGDKYAENLLLEKWQQGADELNRSFYQRNPDYMDKLLMLQKYNVSLFLRGRKIYGLGPLTVYKIYKDIGEDKYYNSMKEVYQKYYDKKDKKLSFTDFLNITGVDKEVAFNE